MKQNNEHKLIQMDMSKPEVVAYGYNKAMRKSWKKVMVRFVVLLVGVMAASAFNVLWLAFVLAIAMFTYLLFWMMKCQQAGKKFWESIKSKPEPVQV